MPFIYLSDLIRFDLSTFSSFIIGVIFGFFVVLLIYVYAVLKGLNKGIKLRKVDEEDIDEEEIKWLIRDAQEEFKNKDKRNQFGFFPFLLEVNKELSVDIASKFYPKSKYPYLELTIDEALRLNHYITDRLEEFLKPKLFRLIRGKTIAGIVEINDAKVKLENSKVAKVAKKYGKVTTAAFAAVNAINPVYWVRRGTQSLFMNGFLLRIGLVLISITGEETYKIYSKKVFNQEKEIDTDIGSIYEELKKDIKEEVLNHEQEKTSR
jgi:hypothetical protein